MKTIVQGLIQDRGSEGLCAHHNTVLSPLYRARLDAVPALSITLACVGAGKLLVGANPMNGWQGPLYPVRQARALL